MAGKISTLILEVDLQCTICSKKIRKVLGKLQGRENTQSVVYDEQKSIVIVSGPFDPKKLSKKLCCKACKVIIDIHIKQTPPPTPPPSTPVKPPPSTPVKPPPSTPVKPPPSTPVKPPRPPGTSSPYPYPYPYPYPAVWAFILVCGCHGWCTCKPATEPSPAPPVVPTCAAPCYDGYRTCKFIHEEEPSYCSIM